MEAVLIPARIDLPALGRSFAVERRSFATAGGGGDPTGRRAAGVTVRERDGVLRLSGNVGDAAACADALRRWLRRAARGALVPELQAEARERGVAIGAVRIGLQRTCWGSRSARGTISLNAALLFLDPPDVRYVLLHELAHARHMNHSASFWALLESWHPGARTASRRLRAVRGRIPDWVRPAGRARSVRPAVRRRLRRSPLASALDRFLGRSLPGRGG